MKKVLIKTKDFIIKNLLGILIGFLIAGSISIATANYAFDGSNVYYNKSSSGGSYDNVQDSITELYKKVNEGSKIYKIDKIEVTPKRACNSFVLGSWKYITTTDGSCQFQATLPVDIASSVDCTGNMHGNYVSSSDTASNESFRFGGGAPYANEIFFAPAYNTITGSGILYNNTNVNSYNGIYWKCSVSNSVLTLEFTGRTTGNSFYASYGWQTRANEFKFSGYIIY